MKKKHKLISFIFFILINFSNLIPQTHIKILPGTTVEVGEEVYFDAVYYAKTISDTLQFEWDFGDGYKLFADSDGVPFETGVCAIHYFMKPGRYLVKLTGSIFDMRKSPPLRISKIINDSITITVTGGALIEGFELWHAPFHARTAQYIYAIVPDGYSPSQVFAQIERVGGGFSQELVGKTIENKQRFLLKNESLPAGEYVIIVELKNGQEVVSRIKEKFSKPYDGAPIVGINENNAFVLNGTTVFLPIGPFMLNKGHFPLWKKVSNTLHTQGYYTEFTPETWIDYINVGNNNSFMSVGPTRWKGFKKTYFYTRNSIPDSLTYYVQQAKNTPGLLGWCWDDEPNMGGRYNKVPAHVCAAWDYRTRLEDPQHPTAQQYYGYDWMPHYNKNFLVPEYTYMRGAYHFGGKKHFISDFFTHDVYPINAKGHASLTDSTKGVIELWIENLENFKKDMADLVPLGTFIETQNVTAFQRLDDINLWNAGPTPGDLRTQLWSAIIHGMKYIGYFQHFAPIAVDNLSVLGEFKEAITDLTPIILSAPSSRTVTHNCNHRGNRVDIMVREDENNVYIFAVRVTEPECEWNEVYEPETINLILNTGINSPIAYDEMPKYQWKYIKLDAYEGQKSFYCKIPEGNIAPNSVIVCAVKRAPSYYNFPEFLIDQWTGKAYPTAFDMVTDGGNLKYGFDDGNGNIISLSTLKLAKISGTVNYSTGEIQLISEEGIPKGKGYVQIAYATSNRKPRVIPINDGIIKDVLERNAVRIYRIPLNVDSIEIQESKDLLNLYKIYPNPFNESTKISFNLNSESHVSIIIYDMLGRLVNKLVDNVLSTGNYEIEWNRKDSQGNKVENGVYILKIKINNKSSFAAKVLAL